MSHVFRWCTSSSSLLLLLPSTADFLTRTTCCRGCFVCTNLLIATKISMALVSIKITSILENIFIVWFIPVMFLLIVYLFSHSLFQWLMLPDSVLALACHFILLKSWNNSTLYVLCYYYIRMGISIADKWGWVFPSLRSVAYDLSLSAQNISIVTSKYWIHTLIGFNPNPSLSTTQVTVARKWILQQHLLKWQQFWFVINVTPH